MLLDAVRNALEGVESNISSGPIVPRVTPQEIRYHLRSHYDFSKPKALNELGADIEHMLQTWQVHVTHPRYFGLFNPSVTLASVVAATLAALHNPQPANRPSPPPPHRMEP